MSQQQQQQQQQQQAAQMQGLSPITQQQVHTPTSATYPSIAPAPMSAPGSPKTAMKRKVSGTPAPGTPGPGQHAQLGGGMQQGGDGMPMNRMSMSGPGGQQNMNMNLNMNMNMNAAQQMANMRMGLGGAGPGGGNQMMNSMNTPNMMPGGGMMGPPGLPRSQSQGPDGNLSMGMNMSGMNGMQAPGLARQASLGDMRNLPANAAANLSINTNINSSMNAQLGSGLAVPSMSMNTPTGIASPNPAMLPGGMNVGLPTMDGTIPSTPRQGSLPPSIGSPFPPGAMLGMNGMERKMSSQGILGGVPPLTRASTSDVFNNGPSGVPPMTASSAMAATTSSLAGVAPNVTMNAQAPLHLSSSVSAPPVSHQLPPLPANVSLNPKVTRVQIVPLIESTTLIPALSEEEIADVQRWMKADKDYEATYRKMRERVTDDVRELVVKTRPWWERDPMEDARGQRRRRDKFDVIGLKSQRDERVRRPKTGKREGFKL